MIEKAPKKAASKSHKKLSGKPEVGRNKTYQSARAALAEFVDQNVPRLHKWLDMVANDVTTDDGTVIRAGDPVKAFELVSTIIEYHIPKLARTELTGKDGEALQVSVNVLPPENS